MQTNRHRKQRLSQLFLRQNCHPERSFSQLHRERRSRRTCGLPGCPWSLLLAILIALLIPLVAAQSPLGQAHWISAPFSTPRDGAELDGSHPLPIFRREFTVHGKLSKAELRIVGLGQFQAQIDSQPIGPAGLHQAWTNYRKTITFETYNVTPKLHRGSNVIGVMLGNGMYNVQKTKGRYTKFDGSFGPPKLIAELRLTYANGRSETITTDQRWKTAPGPTTFSSTYGGEDYDARKILWNWTIPGFDDTSWQPAQPVDGPGGKLIPAIAPEVLTGEPIPSIKTTEIAPNKVVYDFGRNFAGIPRIKLGATKDAILKLTPGELLKPDGSVSQASSGGPMWWTYTAVGAVKRIGPQTWPTDEVWQPQFGYYGFRYLQVEWLANPGKVEEVVGIPLTSNSPATGTFTTSNPTLNAIHNLIVASMHNNEVSLFTDCPHREKLGWLEQTHLAAPSLLFNNDLRALFTATDRNMADAQLETGPDSGDVPTTAPQYTQFGPGKYNIFDDSPEWGSASILAPWWAYKFYGDKAQLATDYPVMQRYLAFLQSKAVDGIVAYGLGDWYDIGPKQPGVSQLTTLGVTGTLMLYEDATTLAQIATLLGHPDDAAHYHALATKEKEAFNTKFLNRATGIYDRGSQTAQSMPLALGIVPESAKPKVLAALIADIHAHTDHTTAGEIGFPYELRALAQNSQDDLIYAMVTNPTAPSYASQLAAGATSLTEAWDANPRNSQDHFMLGHAEDWFYRNLAGINIDLSRITPATRITIAPIFPTGLDSTTATYRSTLGEIKVDWHRHADTVTLDVTVPIPSTLQLPHTPPQPLTPGHHHVTVPVSP